MLLSATLLLVGGGILAATLPPSGGSSGHGRDPGSWAVRSTASAGGAQAGASLRAKAWSTRSAKSSKAVTPPAAAPVLSTITYRVLPGDSLSSVARWFATHGYAVLFSINEPLLRSQPSVIHPGERITITNGVMSVRPSASVDREGADA